MIKHVVCYQLHERTEEKKQEVKNMFMSMKDKIDVIKELQVGLDFLKSARSYDVVLEITFESVGTKKVMANFAPVSKID